ncbi:MAG: metallophosphoesterase [Polyangiaceae bacterium]|nr:metallophosphoesterase [Polyangiaceae bacterium]
MNAKSGRRGWVRTLGVFSVAAALAQMGCYRPEPVAPGFSFASHAVRDGDNREVLSIPLSLVSDTQIHYLYGDPTFPRIEWIDQINSATQVAVRPVQLDYYARDLFRWLILSVAEQPFIHLGDSADLSCRQEFQVLIDELKVVNTGRYPRSEGNPWFLTPGNHDGYFYGHRNVDADGWNNACGSSLDKDKNGAMNKADFVTMYLSNLASQNGKSLGFAPHRELQKLFNTVRVEDKTCNMLPSNNRAECVPTGGDFTYPSQPGQLLRNVAWQIDRNEPWRSFVVQQLNLTAGDAPAQVRAILLDTSAYSSRPYSPVPIGLNAGVTGSVLPVQLKLIHKWAQEASATPNTVLVLMGHHPFDELDDDSKKSLGEFIDNYKVPIYVSSHTHAGFWKSHGSGTSSWIELNVGSTTDFPPERREFVLAKTNGRLELSTPLTRLNERARDSNFPLPVDCEEHWQAAPGDPEYDDYYLDYMFGSSLSAEATQHNLWDALLRSHRRLFSTVKTHPDNSEPWPMLLGELPGKAASACENDDAIIAAIEGLLKKKGSQFSEQKARFLAEIDRFDHKRKELDPTCSQRFRRCQALWASQHEFLRDRKLEPHDDTLLFPWR